ncbi:hypothetical protein BDB00DRAFT_789695 [Zychaea mexicana]|uniref:uncharacterized protein n=1 Tax=Zychaea mexicana TaxID=64656 RepID=UPI0022FDB79C|nr:uncharacterized protein BDB00DRAFT_789695 [Zychaea mexicana]KAI9491312.1 hypothetical protein BDB00DRAFT_789695 [Zychaea mexicana]
MAGNNRGEEIVTITRPAQINNLTEDFSLGPIFRLNMGVKSWIVIGDKYIANGPAFTNPDKRWKKCRAITQEVLAPKSVKRIASTIEREATGVSELLRKRTVERESVDVVKDLRLASVNVIIQTCFGRTIASPDDPLFESVLELLDTTMEWGASQENIRSFLPAFTKMLNLYMRSEKDMADYI